MKRPARFVDEDRYDSASSPDDPSQPSQSPSKKQRVAEWPSPVIAADPEPSWPAATPSLPQAPANDERDELVEEQLETQAAPTNHIGSEITEEHSVTSSSADIVEEASASEKITGSEPVVNCEAEKAEKDNEDQEEVEDRECLFGPSEDGESKKSVSEELPWIKAALQAAGLDADGNELPPELEADY